ncbi:malonyl-CoA decarboxylase, mitochondrial-like [Acanthaster planci]|uniref:Malonyl-CoA decarboxylase, mitochondrial-like n=1 Tax=Acanthaster planci TaxID=133434 RepID=A0A8B7XNR4_ACAPL|nr:malonyl-CoA decarboxylase, mitochondrial-like [Acanthaster planci]
MLRRFVILAASQSLAKIKCRVLIDCHVCLARRHRFPLSQHLTYRPLSTPPIMEDSQSIEQHDLVRDLLPDLLTSTEGGRWLPGRSLVMSEAQIRRVCSRYSQLDEPAKAKFLLALSQMCGIHHESVFKAAKNLQSVQEKEEAVLLQSEQRLTQMLTPGYKLLFANIARLENGIKFLVDMRADIHTFLHHQQQSLSTEAHLRMLQATLKDMLSHWFSAGLLQLQTITWQSSCEMLQKISEYEAVHPVRGWADLKRRVGPYRRCFVYTHSSMPQEPVIILHAALTDHIPASIKSIVGETRDRNSSKPPLALEEQEDPGRITAAIFYSISSTQMGLRGVDLGNHLIKHAVRTLQADFPHLGVFSSLSPIPGFRNWLLAEIGRHHKGENAATLFTADELKAVHSMAGRSDESQLATMRRLLSTNQWAQLEKLIDQLEHPLMRLCARYLYTEKHRGFALDSVANFHLGNGAVMWRLNWMGDPSPRGLTASCGMMVNYRYYLESTQQNSQSYALDQRVATTEQVLGLAEESRLLEQKSSL